MHDLRCSSLKVRHLSSIYLEVRHLSSIYLEARHLSSIYLEVRHLSSIYLEARHLSSIYLEVQHLERKGVRRLVDDGLDARERALAVAGLDELLHGLDLVHLRPAIASTSVIDIGRTNTLKYPEP